MTRPVFAPPQVPALGPTPPVDVVRSPRARRVSVRVDRMTGAIRVTLPIRAPEAEVDRALARHRRWIAARVAEAADVRARVEARGDRIVVWDEDLDVVREPGRARVRRDEDRLLVPAAEPVALERWLRAQARARLVPATEETAAALGRTVTRVSIGDARTRWGSCSARGAIAYSYRLVLAPSWVARAIVWHEVCHLVHLDHSPRFWALLREHEPRTDDARAWLRAHGATLTVAPSAGGAA